MNSNGIFDLHWYRKIPGVVAASSYDGKLGIYNLGVRPWLKEKKCFNNFGCCYCAVKHMCIAGCSLSS